MKKEKILYVVHCIDTEGPLKEPLVETFLRIEQIFGIKISPTRENLLKLQTGKIDLGDSTEAVKKLCDPKLISFNENWDDISHMLSIIGSSEFRKNYRDSIGAGWLYNWFCLDHVGYETNPRYRDLGHHKVYDFYTTHCGRASNKQDKIFFHYHPLPFNKMAHSSATFYFNSNHLFEIFSRKIIDRSWFPSVFRPGFHTIRPDSNWFLEQWIPFDYSNQASESEIDQPDLSDGRFGDWRRAPKIWGSYHPSHDDYQTPGNCRRSIFRCLNMKARLRQLNEFEVNDAFKQADNKGEAVLSFTNHDFRDMKSEIDSVYTMIKKVEKSWPNVKFRYLNALEAARMFLGMKKIDLLDLNIKIEQKNKEHHELLIHTKYPVFGPQPFLALKSKKGLYFHDNLDYEIIKNGWKYTLDWQTFPLQSLEKIGVAAVGSAGQVEVIVMDISTGDVKKTKLNYK